MFKSLLKVGVGIFVDTPASIIGDVVTLGGALTDTKEPYTATALKNVKRNIEEAVNSEVK